ncbi:hypothetical protein KKA15_04945 [Patescibacteria group bacterium]|nr:hypothetical protein [Patescibacteria group bacterium]
MSDQFYCHRKEEFVSVCPYPENRDNKNPLCWNKGCDHARGIHSTKGSEISDIFSLARQLQILSW